MTTLTRIQSHTNNVFIRSGKSELMYILPRKSCLHRYFDSCGNSCVFLFLGEAKIKTWKSEEKKTNRNRNRTSSKSKMDKQVRNTHFFMSSVGKHSIEDVTLFIHNFFWHYHRDPPLECVVASIFFGEKTSELAMKFRLFVNV